MYIQGMYREDYSETVSYQAEFLSDDPWMNPGPGMNFEI